MGYGYDDASRVISSTLPNGVQISYGYDNANRLASVSSSITSTTLSVYTYTLDSQGNRTQVQDLSGTRVYTYNEGYWLKNERLGDGSVVTYTYTISTGNRAAKVDGAGTTVYTYTNDTVLAQAGVTAYNWDDSGNLTSRDSDTYSYDYANRMTQAVVGGITTTYTYNGKGLRVSKSTSGGSSNSFFWDLSLEVPRVISDSNYVYIYGLGPIGMVDAQGNDYYLLRDGLGSVTGIVDASGTLTATYNYDAYGSLRSSTGTLSNAFRFTGEWYDGETNFYYLRARHYDPRVGRFITRDQWPGVLAKPYSLNPYLYVENNPADKTDPTGLTPQDGLCTGIWGNDDVNIRLMRNTCGVMKWDFRMTKKRQARMTDEVVVGIGFAMVNAIVINPPYSPHKRAKDYDFHSTLFRYDSLWPRDIHSTVQTGDQLTLLWWAMSYPFNISGFVRFLRCVVPEPGGGWDPTPWY